MPRQKKKSQETLLKDIDKLVDKLQKCKEKIDELNKKEKEITEKMSYMMLKIVDKHDMNIFDFLDMVTERRNERIRMENNMNKEEKDVVDVEEVTEEETVKEQVSDNEEKDDTETVNDDMVEEKKETDEEVEEESGSTIQTSPLMSNADYSSYYVPIAIPLNVYRRYGYQSEYDLVCEINNAHRKVLLYSSYVKPKLDINWFNKTYFNKLSNIEEHVITKYDDPDHVCCSISRDLIYNETDYMSFIIATIHLSEEFPYSDILLKIIQTSNISLVPIYSKEYKCIGAHDPLANFDVKISRLKLSHLALCIGRINNRYLII